MKKVLKLLLITLLVLPITVLADMGSPYIKPFEAVIVKKGGITVKNYNGKTKHYNESDVVLVTSLGNQIEIYNDVDDYYEVSSSDTKYIVPKSSEVKPGDDGVKKLEKQREFEVVLTELKVYKGPSVVFKEAGSLSKGTQVTAFYEFETELARSEWFYIQEENVSGWIDIGADYGKYSVYEVNAKPLKVIFKNDVTINGFEVKANSIYKINYWANPYLGINPVIKVNNENVEYDSYDEKSNVEVFSDSKKKQSIFHHEQYNFTINKDIKLYKDASLKDEITTIPKGTTLSTINLVDSYGMQGEDKYLVYVNYDNKIGWIKVGNVESKEITVLEDYTTDELVAPYVDPEGDDGEDTEETTQAVVEEKKDETKLEHKFDTKETIIISVIGAISLAVVAISSIVMLNKKNKKDTLKEINEELEKTQKIEIIKEDNTEEK